MTKILATIGPETESQKDLSFILKKTNFLRLNGSHNTLKWHKATVKKIYNIKKDINILVDLPGIKPRTKNSEKITILKDQLIIFYFEKLKNKNKNLTYIELTNPIPSNFPKKKFLTLSDGRYKFKILKSRNNLMMTKSLASFTLNTNQGLNIPYSVYNETKQQKIYIKFLKNYLKNINNITSIGLSFVQTEAIVKKIKKLFPNLLIISKIENYKGLENIEKICESSDGIMIDRGDLSAEIGEEKLYDAIIKIIKNANKFNIPIILATENLTSMLKNPSPSKSEIFSLGYLQSLKIDRVMLSEETAISKNWKLILSWLYKHLERRNKMFKINTKKNITQNFWEIFYNIKNLPTVLFTKKGYAISKILNNKNIDDLIIFTDNKKLHQLNKIRSNLRSYLTNKFDNKRLSKFIFQNIKKKRKSIFKKNNELVALIYISNPKKNSRANTLQIVSKSDFN